jgi:hypothetical protein
MIVFWILSAASWRSSSSNVASASYFRASVATAVIAAIRSHSFAQIPFIIWQAVAPANVNSGTASLLAQLVACGFVFAYLENAAYNRFSYAGKQTLNIIGKVVNCIC